MHWISFGAAGVTLILDLIFFLHDQALFLFLIGLVFFVLALPFVVGLTLENKKEQKINEMFLEFTRNLAESVSAGTPVSKSIINMKKKNYGALNDHVVKLANQIELGIPIGRAFDTFARDVNSGVVKRAIGLIREAERAGGEIDYILDSTAKSISEVEKLKKERKSAIYNLVVQGYIIFFIFIGIVLVMEYKIIPLTAGVGELGNLQSIGGGTDFANLNKESKSEGGLTPQSFSKPFLVLLVTQGFFIGLAIGKLTEGSIKSGVKHSFILMISAFLVSTGSKLFFTPAVS